MSIGTSSAGSARPRSLVRPLVSRLHAYVPGEQPKVKGLIKLNTNENPYPPSPRVMAAIKAAVDDRLRLYPNPTAQALREKLAKLHRCSPENIIIGNGSDELLALARRAGPDPRDAMFMAAEAVDADFADDLAGEGPRMEWHSQRANTSLAARFSWPWSAERHVQVLHQTAAGVPVPAVTPARVARGRKKNSTTPV